MPIFLPLLTCVNLSGNYSGDCLYRSETYGDLEGILEISIQQPNCKEIIFDGQKVEIPGEITEEVKDGENYSFSKLEVNWQDQAQTKLNFQSHYVAEEKGKRIDDVSLGGHFEKSDDHLKVFQTGTVDGDKVQVTCDLKPSS